MILHPSIMNQLRNELPETIGEVKEFYFDLKENKFQMTPDKKKELIRFMKYHIEEGIGLGLCNVFCWFIKDTFDIGYLGTYEIQEIMCNTIPELKRYRPKKYHIYWFPNESKKKKN